MKRIEFVDLHIAADLNVPTESFLEDAVTQPMNLCNLVYKVAVVVSGNQLHHDHLLQSNEPRHLELARAMMRLL
jgi:hypothetical protein